MKDVEFVSELFIVLIDGVQDGQKTIDEFYATFDSRFPSKTKYVRRFDAVLQRIANIPLEIEKTRFRKKADFYGLFAALESLAERKWPKKKLRNVAAALRDLAKELERPPERLRGVALEYYGTVIEGPNKLAKRRKRTNILSSLIENALG